MNDQTFAAKYTTIRGAADILGTPWRNKVEHHIKAGHIAYVTVCPNTPHKIRLLVKKDVERLADTLP